jgi:hypothetical protein
MPSINIYVYSSSRLKPFPPGSRFVLLLTLVVDEKEREKNNESPYPVEAARILRTQYHLSYQ